MKRRTNDRDVCHTCLATRREHSVDQWIYCHLPMLVVDARREDIPPNECYGILSREVVGEA